MREIEYENEVMNNKILDKKVLDLTWRQFLETGAIMDYLLYSKVKSGYFLNNARQMDNAAEIAPIIELKAAEQIEKGIKNDATNDNSRSRAESDRLQRE